LGVDQLAESFHQFQGDFGFSISETFDQAQDGFCIVRSSNHLVGSGQHIRRNRQSDLLGGLEIDSSTDTGSNLSVT
jgi:hypothetical protein